MTVSTQKFIQLGEKTVVISRARTYLLVRLAVDVVLLIFVMLQALTAAKSISVVLVILLDLVGLLVYRITVKRWPTASTYLQLIFTTLLIIAFDFAWGSITFIPWFLTIPLSIVGGFIVTRSGFNGLVTLSILAIFGVYTGFIWVGRVPLPVEIPGNTLLVLSAALGAVLLILNALTESLVVYLYQTEESLLQTRAQLLYAMQELEQNRNLLHKVQNQTRRMERLSTVGQIAEQLSKSLRGPLEEIEGILRNPERIQENPELIKELHRQVLAALRMTEGLKEYARLTELHIKTVNLDDVLAKELAQTRIPENVKLVIHQPPVFPPIQADPDKVRLVIHHLLDNALHAVQDGGEITIELQPRPDGVAFTIHDSGSGIPQDELQLIFEPLYTTHAEGFGLGLAIAQRVVEMHGGYIEVESEEGKGSKFTIFFPRVPEAATEATGLLGAE